MPGCFFTKVFLQEQGTASEALAVWMNGDDQAGIFNADYTAAGVGAITAGGVSYWVLLYGKQVTTPADMNAYTSSTVSAKIPLFLHPVFRLNFMQPAI